MRDSKLPNAALVNAYGLRLLGGRVARLITGARLYWNPLSKQLKIQPHMIIWKDGPKCLTRRN